MAIRHADDEAGLKLAAFSRRENPAFGDSNIKSASSRGFVLGDWHIGGEALKANEGRHSGEIIPESVTLVTAESMFIGSSGDVDTICWW